MPETRCELCDDPTPARLLHRAPQRGWADGLCPACWMLNRPSEAATSAETPEQDLAGQMLMQYAMQWHSHQHAMLTHGLGGTSQGGQASGLATGLCGGLCEGLFGGLGIVET